MMTPKLENLEIENIFEFIKSYPQTYGSLLNGMNTPTNQIIIRRKINNLLRDGKICKAAIPGTRFGMNIFFVLPKDYHIIVNSERIGSVIYCCSKLTKQKMMIKLDDGKMLRFNEWKEVSNKVLFEGSILKWI